MPVVDKYDLYSPFIKEKQYEASQFFELLRPLEKDYVFIDSKAKLEPLVQEGQKDIFYVDDTHWTYRAAEAVLDDFPMQTLQS